MAPMVIDATAQMAPVFWSMVASMLAAIVAILAAGDRSRPAH